MKKKIVKSLILFGVIILANFAFSPKVRAALNISVPKSEVSAGESFSVTVSVAGNEAAAVNLAVSNGTLSSSTVDLMSSNSSTITCIAGSSGNVTISASGTVANYDSETEEKQSASKTVTIKTANVDNGSNNNSNSGNSSNNQGKSTNNNSSKKDSNLTAITVDGIKYTNGQTVPAVENSKNNVKVLAVGTSRYSIKVNGNSVSGNSVNLEEGTNEIVVTNLDDGNSIKVYLSRKAKENTTPNVIDETTNEEIKKELKLSKLEIKNFEMSPTFSEDIYAYVINIDMDKQDVSSLELETIANDENSKITIQGNENFKEGENIVYIILENENGTKVTYQITVNKVKSSSEVIATAESNSLNAQNDGKANLMDRMIFSVVIIVVILLGGIIITIVLIVVNNKKEKEELINNSSTNNDFENNVIEPRKVVKGKHKGKRFK